MDGDGNKKVTMTKTKSPGIFIIQGSDDEFELLEEIKEPSACSCLEEESAKNILEPPSSNIGIQCQIRTRKIGELLQQKEIESKWYQGRCKELEHEKKALLNSLKIEKDTTRSYHDLLVKVISSPSFVSTTPIDYRNKIRSEMMELRSKSVNNALL